MRWVTRAPPTIDRIACPWLITRFIDPAPEFLFVPRGRVLAVAARQSAVPYDTPGSELAHAGDRCSFDAFLHVYGLKDGALDRLAAIVRGADTVEIDLALQSSGLFAIARGLSAAGVGDRDMLEHGFALYDALYAWCKECREKPRCWPTAMHGAAP